MESHDRHECHERERYLHEEDRSPAEQLGQDAACARPERRPENARSDPDACRTGDATRRRGKEIESSDDDERCPDRLDAARGNEHLERPCKPTRERCPRKDENATDERWAWPAPGYESGRHGNEREHEVEGGENPGNRRDPHIEPPEYLGKRERDNRRIRQREPDGETK